MALGDRLNALLNAHGITVAELSRLSGVSAQSIYSIIRRNSTKVELDSLQRIADALSVTLDYFANDQLANVDDFNGHAPDPWHAPLTTAYEAAEVPRREAACDVLRIPYVDPGKPAAIPAAPSKHSANVVSFPAPFADDDDVPEEEEMIVFHYPSAAGMPLYIESDYERIKFPYLAVPTKADFGVRIEGDSMEPEIHSGDIVWVYKTPEISDGQIGIFQLEDGAVCKKARLLPNGKLDRLESINPEYDDITGSVLRGVRCVGRVLRAYSPDKDN